MQTEGSAKIGGFSVFNKPPRTTAAVNTINPGKQSWRRRGSDTRQPRAGNDSEAEVDGAAVRWFGSGAGSRLRRTKGTTTTTSTKMAAPAGALSNRNKPTQPVLGIAILGVRFRNV